MTPAQVAKRPCHRCGKKPGYAVWDCCADRNVQRVLCALCDIKLNQLVLKWANDPRWRAKMDRYRRVMAAA